jgi:hypothetical protein
MTSFQTSKSMAAHILAESNNLSNEFSNFNYAGRRVTPADPIIAVGSKSFITMINLTFGIYNKVTMKEIYVDSLANLWNVSSSGGDPYIVYDEFHERFFLIAFGEAVFQPQTDLLIAVSKDSNPQSHLDFHLYKYQSVRVADFPKIAVDREAVYVTAQGFSPRENPIWAFEKSAILNGPSDQNLIPVFQTLVIRDSPNNRPEFIFPLQPRPSTDGSDKVVFIKSNLSNVTSSNYQSEHVRLMYVNNVLTNPNLVTYDLQVPVYSGYAFQLVQQPFPKASQWPLDAENSFTSLIDLDTIIGYFSGVNVAGSVWATHTVFSEDGKKRVVVRWYEIAIGDFVRENKPPVLLQSGNVDSGGFMNHIIPSINVDDKKTMAVNFTLVGLEQYPVIAYTGRLSSDEPGTTRLPLQKAKGGDLYYQQTFGGSRNRWGDYSGLAIDPIDRIFWLYNMYPVELGVQSPPVTTPLSSVVQVEGVGCFSATLTLQTRDLLNFDPVCAPGVVVSPRNGCGPSQKTQIGSTIALPMDELGENVAVNGVIYELSAGLKLTAERDPYFPEPVPSELGEWVFVKKSDNKIYAQCGKEEDPLTEPDVVSPVDTFRSAMLIRTTNPRQFAEFDLKLFWSTEDSWDFLNLWINESLFFSVSGANGSTYNQETLRVSLSPGDILSVEFSKNLSVKQGYDSIYFNIENLALFSSPVSGAIAIVLPNPDDCSSSVYVEKMAQDGALATLILNPRSDITYRGATGQIAVVLSEIDGIRLLDALTNLPTPPLISILINEKIFVFGGSDWTTYVQAFRLQECCCPNQRRNQPDNGGIPPLTKSVLTPSLPSNTEQTLTTSQPKTLKKPTSLSTIQKPTSLSTLQKPTSLSTIQKPTTLQKPTSLSTIQKPTTLQKPTSLSTIQKPTTLQKPTSLSMVQNPTALLTIQKPTTQIVTKTNPKSTSTKFSKVKQTSSNFRLNERSTSTIDSLPVFETKDQIPKFKVY